MNNITPHRRPRAAPWWFAACVMVLTLGAGSAGADVIRWGSPGTTTPTSATGSLLPPSSAETSGCS